MGHGRGRELHRSGWRGNWRVCGHNFGRRHWRAVCVEGRARRGRQGFRTHSAKHLTFPFILCLRRRFLLRAVAVIDLPNVRSVQPRYRNIIHIRIHQVAVRVTLQLVDVGHTYGDGQAPSPERIADHVPLLSSESTGGDAADAPNQFGKESSDKVSPLPLLLSSLWIRCYGALATTIDESRTHTSPGTWGLHAAGHLSSYSPWGSEATGCSRCRNRRPEHFRR